MDSPSKLESLAVRFAPYVGDLHEYFVQCGMPFGSPEDLGPFAHAVTIPGAFHDDLCSLLRSVIYRENKSINVVELLQLLLVAVGGLHVDEAAADMRDSVRRLLEFVREVYRSLLKSPDMQSTEPANMESAIAAPKHFRAHAPAAKEFVAATSRNEDPHHATERTTERISPYSLSSERLGSATEPATSFTVFSHARALAAEMEETQASGERTFLPEPTFPPEALPSVVAADPSSIPHPSLPKAPAAVAGPLPPPPARHSTSRRWLWMAAFAAVAAMIFAKALLGRRPHFSTATVATSAPRSAGPARSSIPAGAAPVYAGASSVAPADQSGPAMADADAAEPEDARRPEPETPAPVQSHNAADVPDPPVKAGTASKDAVRASTQPGGTQAAFASPEPLPKAIYPETERDAPPLVATRTSRPERPIHDLPNLRPGAIAVSSGIMAKNLLAAPAPEYPRLARMTHTQGEVVLQAFVARDGSVMATHILRGPFMLRGAAEHAVRRWRYRPFLFEGRATAVATVVSVDFRLHP